MTPARVVIALFGAMVVASEVGQQSLEKLFSREPLQPEIVKVFPIEDEHVDDLLAEYAAEYQVPLSLVQSVARHENYRDWESNDARSVKGALGIMQIMPNYHAGEGKTCGEFIKSWTDLVGKRNRRNNVRCGVLVLKTYLDEAQRKASAQAMSDAVFSYNKDREYVRKVLAMKAEIEKRG